MVVANAVFPQNLAASQNPAILKSRHMMVKGQQLCALYIHVHVHCMYTCIIQIVLLLKLCTCRCVCVDICRL